MNVLGIDTSNYATSLAVVDTDAKEVVCALKRFLPVKKGGLGLRQSEAVFHHTTALPNLLQEVNSHFPLSLLGGIGVSARPRPVDGSYMPCFLTGLGCAQALGMALECPVIETTHQQGHVAAALFAACGDMLFDKDVLVFHISGGTTDLLLCHGFHVLHTVGSTDDLYAGQAVDRIGVRLGFSFPAGAQLSKLAEQCSQEIHPRVSVRGTHCSLSGLENQCNALLEHDTPTSYVAKYCLSAIAQVAVEMIENARTEYPGLAVVCAGGVMSSDIIRAYVQKRVSNTFFVPGQYSSDNAIGVALIAAMEAGAWQM